MPKERNQGQEIGSSTQEDYDFQFYVWSGSKALGPFDLDTIKNARVAPGTLVYGLNSKKWIELEQILRRIPSAEDQLRHLRRPLVAVSSRGSAWTATDDISRPLAGFWIRFLALGIDLFAIFLIILLTTLGVGAVGSFLAELNEIPSTLYEPTLARISITAWSIFILLYLIVPPATAWQATLGKRIVSIYARRRTMHDRIGLLEVFCSRNLILSIGLQSTIRFFMGYMVAHEEIFT